MPLFKHRPLATLCVLFLFGIFVSVVADGVATVFVGTLSAFLLFLFLLLAALPRQKAKRKSIFLCLCAAVLLFSQIFSHLAYRQPLSRLPFDGSEITVEGRVEEVTFSSDDLTKCHVTLSKLAGEKASGRVMVSFACRAEIWRGDHISFSASFTPLNEKEAAYQRAEGFLAQAESTKAPTLLFNKLTAADRIGDALASLRDRLSSRLTENIEGEGGRLLAAMLLGDRDALSSATARDFRRLGMSHVLAISGLHLHILFFLFSALFSRLGVKRSRALLFLSLLLVFYIALTGFSLSVLRAGAMALLLTLSFLVREQTDSITSLSLGATLICLASPTSIYDVGFLLSCFATLGILIAVELQGKRALKKRVHFFLQKIGSAVLITLSATLATLPITALYFGEISLFSLPANLFLTPLFSFYLACAPLALLLAPLSFVGSIFAALGNALLCPLALLSDLPHAMLDISYTDVLVIVLGGSALFLLLLCCVRSRRALAVTGGCVLTLFALSLTAHTMLLYTRSDLRYFESAGNEYILLTDKGDGLLYEASNAAFRARDEAFSLLKEAHLCELDGYMLSHYHTGHPEAVERVFSKIRVGTLYLPTPTSYEEERVCRKLVALAAEHRVSVRLYSAREELSHGPLTLTPFYSTEKGHPTLALSVKWEDRMLTYLASDESALCAPAVKKSQYLIFGTHGGSPNARLPFTQYHKNLLSVSCAQAQERMPPALYALLYERGVLHEESRFLLPLP